MPIDTTISPSELEVIEQSKRVDYQPRPASESTNTLVGSAERLAIYRQRFFRGEHLYHDSDTTQRIA
jgi:hypothetical protein